MLLPTPFVGTPTWRYRHAQLTDSGLLHPGIDLYHPNVNEVVAVADGLVQFAGPARGWGTLVVIEHDGLISRYGHMDELRVTRGEQVTAGQALGMTGTGRGLFSRHLHYDLIDPEGFRRRGRLDWMFYQHTLSNFARIYRDPREFHPEIDAELAYYDL